MDGFEYVPEVISSEEEKRLVDAIDAVGWYKTRQEGGRARVQHYGYEYSYRSRTLMAAPPIPDFLRDVAERLSISCPDQIIVNEYLSGENIGPHVDNTKCFGEKIHALSLAGDGVLVFKRSFWGDDTEQMVRIAKRSLYTLSGDSRYNWTHETLPLKFVERRISITFRSVINNMEIIE